MGEDHPSTGASPGRFGRQLAVFGLVVGCLLAIGVGIVLIEFRHAAIHRDEQELKRMALVLAEQAERAFQSLEAAQTGLQQEMRNQEIDTQEEFRDQKNDADIHASLRQRIEGLAHVDLLALIDDQGHVVGHSHPLPMPDGNLSNREFFTVLRDGPADARYISAPLTDPDGTVWTVHIAQRVTGQDGAFLGVVLGAVRLRYFESLYGTVAATSGDVISLVHGDGDVLARYPALPGRPQDGATNPLAASQKAPAVPAGEMEHLGITPHDFTAAHKLEKYPIEVRVSRAAHDVLRGWHQEALVIAAGAGLVELGLAGIVLLGVRQIRSQGRLAHAERERRVQDMRFATAMEHLSQGVCMLDREGRVAVVNPRLREMLSLPAGQNLSGLSLGQFARMAVAAHAVTPADLRYLRRAVRQLPEARPASISWHLADGRIFVVEVDSTPDGGWLATLEDATERHLAEARIFHLAHHDPLTGLANRTLFSQRLSEAIARAGAGVSGALLLIDLDRFKRVNDEFGHPVGDALLVAAAERLRVCLREGDLAARLGGDEFAVIQAGGTQPDGARALGARLVATLGAPYELDGNRLEVRASVGTAVIGSGDDTQTLMRKADIALYRAKDGGRARHVLFGEEDATSLQ
jgi:diguanylate cyclase (GGDEF)-like protein